MNVEASISPGTTAILMMQVNEGSPVAVQFSGALQRSTVLVHLDKGKTNEITFWSQQGPAMTVRQLSLSGV